VSDTATVLILCLLVLILVGPRLREELRWLRGEKLPRLEPWTLSKGDSEVDREWPLHGSPGPVVDVPSPFESVRRKERA
jgi:hypothetical protein